LRALSGEIEPTKIPERPLDVLMQFLAGLLVERGEVEVSEALSMARGSACFRGLSEPELLSVARFMSSPPRPMARLEGGRIRRGFRRRLFSYHYDTLSMIPELRQYLVVEEESRRPVGVLDEPFVMERGEPGVRFIMAGSAWEITRVSGQRVYVRPSDSLEGAVPYWLGEEIPVPYEVAQEVGRLRSEAEEAARSGRPLSDLARGLSERYPADPGVVERALRPAYEQALSGLPVPTHERVVAERVGDLTVVHVHAGTLINRALARAAARALTSRLGATVQVDEDPYRLYFRGSVSTGDALEVLSDPDLIRAEGRAAAEASGFFRYRLSQAARKMGVVARDATLTPADVRRMAEALRGTPVYEQAMRDVLQRDLDLEGAVSVSERLRSGEWEVRDLGERGRHTPVAAEGVGRLGPMERVPPSRRRFLEIQRIRAELLSSEVTLSCLACGTSWTEVVYSVPERPSCPRCGSDLVAASRLSPIEAELAISGIRRSKKAARALSLLRRSSSLVRRFGRDAVALMAFGLSPGRAERLLREHGGLTDSLLAALAEERKRRLLAIFRG
ncbi:MAG: hypothetical protein DRO06_05150, partial [Thermoproteota archaeon]